MLTLKDIRYYWGPQPVLDGVSLFVGRGEKAGLVGANGAGKTTLLRIAAGEITPDGGSVGRPNRTGYLPQEPDVSEAFPATASVRDVVVSASPTAALAQQLAAAEQRLTTTTGPALEAAVEEYSRLEEAYRVADGYQVEAEAAIVLRGLGLGHIELDRQIGRLSSGERTRLEMARILASGASLLMLDEPTNHLDVDGTRWLMEFLARTEAAVLLVSHDLRLLDKSISRVFDLDVQTRQIEEFKGTYSNYLAWSEERKATLTKTRSRQIEQIDRLQMLADKWRKKTEVMARRAKVFDRRIARMKEEVVDVPTEARSLGLHFPPAPRSGRVTLRASGIRKRYGRNPVLSGTSFMLERGQRLAVIGVNGAGKSTLLNILAGRLPADAGAVTMGHQVKLGHFAHGLAQDTADLTPYEYLLPLVSGGEREIRSTLAGLLLGEDHAFRPIATLSSGERARLGIAKLMLERHNLLLLDEPNSNLDVHTREWLLLALDEYRPTLVVVSHDRDFVAGLHPDHVLLMPGERHEAFRSDHLRLVELE